MKNELKYFGVSGDPMKSLAMPGSTFTTDAMDVSNFPGKFIIQVKRSQNDGTATFIIESSNDGLVWNKYLPMTDVSGSAAFTKTQDAHPWPSTLEIAISTSTNQAMIQDYSVCLPNYLRLVFTVSGSPTGNITASILLSK